MRLLLIAGHGDGDPGATAAFGGRIWQEAEETRRVAAALAEALAGRCAVERYPAARNAYADYRRGTLAETARFAEYDLVLELHFNAFRPAAADGKTKGVECYVPAGGDRAAAERLCGAAAACGLTNRGVKEKDWAVIAAARRAGTAACLLELCFLDDEDDMVVYTARFRELTQALAGALAPRAEMEAEAVYETAAAVPEWGRGAVEKALERGLLLGGGDGLALSRELVRMLVILDRAGVLDGGTG